MSVPNEVPGGGQHNPTVMGPGITDVDDDSPTSSPPPEDLLYGSTPTAHEAGAPLVHSQAQSPANPPLEAPAPPRSLAQEATRSPEHLLDSTAAPAHFQPDTVHATKLKASGTHAAPL